MELGNLWQIQQIMLKATQPDQAGPVGPNGAAVEFQAWRAGTVYTALVLKTLWLEGEWEGGSKSSLSGCVCVGVAVARTLSRVESRWLTIKELPDGKSIKLI